MTITKNTLLGICTPNPKHIEEVLEFQKDLAIKAHLVLIHVQFFVNPIFNEISIEILETIATISF